MPVLQRACVYFDFKNNEENSERGALRVYGESVTLKELKADSDKLARYGEEFYGFRIYFEDELVKTKRIDVHA